MLKILCLKVLRTEIGWYCYSWATIWAHAVIFLTLQSCPVSFSLCSHQSEHAYLPRLTCGLMIMVHEWCPLWECYSRIISLGLFFFREERNMNLEPIITFALFFFSLSPLSTVLLSSLFPLAHEHPSPCFAGSAVCGDPIKPMLWLHAASDSQPGGRLERPSSDSPISPLQQQVELRCRKIGRNAVGIDQANLQLGCAIAGWRRACWTGRHWQKRKQPLSPAGSCNARGLPLA